MCFLCVILNIFSKTQIYINFNLLVARTAHSYWHSHALTFINRNYFYACFCIRINLVHQIEYHMIFNRLTYELFFSIRKIHTKLVSLDPVQRLIDLLSFAVVDVVNRFLFGGFWRRHRFVLFHSFGSFSFVQVHSLTSF